MVIHDHSSSRDGCRGCAAEIARLRAEVARLGDLCADHQRAIIEYREENARLRAALSTIRDKLLLHSEDSGATFAVDAAIDTATDALASSGAGKATEHPEDRSGGQGRQSPLSERPVVPEAPGDARCPRCHEKDIDIAWMADRLKLIGNHLRNIVFPAIRNAHDTEEYLGNVLTGKYPSRESVAHWLPAPPPKEG